MPSDAVFQHIATFYSLIIGLAVANVLSAIANTAKSDAQVRWYWLHSAAAGMLILVMVQDWWFLLSWEGSVRVSHPILVFLIARASVLYIASNFLIPQERDADDGVIDLRVHMLRVRRRFFVALAAYSLLDFADTLLKGRERLIALGPVYPYYVVIFFTLMVAAAASRRERIAGGVVVIMIALHVWAVIGRALGAIE